MRLPSPFLALLLLSAGTRPLAGQVRLFVAGFAGAAFEVGNGGRSSGGGLGYQWEVGARLGRVVLAGEYGHHASGSDHDAELIGAIIRLPAMTRGAVRPYVVAGLAEYHYTPVIGGTGRALGGSAGVGAFFTFRSERTGALLEARYHSALTGLGAFSSREFASVVAGLQVGL